MARESPHKRINHITKVKNRRLVLWVGSFARRSTEMTPLRQMPRNLVVQCAPSVPSSIVVLVHLYFLVQLPPSNVTPSPQNKTTRHKCVQQLAISMQTLLKDFPSCQYQHPSITKHLTCHPSGYVHGIGVTSILFLSIFIIMYVTISSFYHRKTNHYHLTSLCCSLL
jgi:hypothetical protein